MQLALYRSLGGTDRFAFDIWQAFCYHTGWIVAQPICAISAVLGHLPWLARPEVLGLDSHDALVWSADPDEEADWRFLYGIFCQRIEHCLARADYQGDIKGDSWQKQRSICARHTARTQDILMPIPITRRSGRLPRPCPSLIAP